MGMLLFIAFLVVPIIEIIGFIQIGTLIGLWPTLGIVILTAIAGSMLLQYQGMTAFLEAQSKLREGTLPVDEVVDGFCLALAGALLLTPGFFTDTVGFLLFVPDVRRRFARFVFQRYIKPNATFYTDDQRGPAAQEAGPFEDGVVIDGEYEDLGGDKKTSRSLHVPDTGDKTSPANGGKNTNGETPWRGDK